MPRFFPWILAGHRRHIGGECGELIAVFQPIVDLDTGRPVGYESLTRFRDGVSPATRFADAVTLGIGPDLEEMAIRPALAESSALPADCWTARSGRSSSS